MAKKGARNILTLVCSECKAHNYTTEKNKVNDPKELILKKFCSRRRKTTEHKEKKKQLELECRILK